AAGPERRRTRATVKEPVKGLPRIRSAESRRSSISDTRLARPDASGLRLRWPDGREQLIADTTLAHLPLLPAGELESTLARLRAFERELSDLRSAMHEVIDTVEREIAARQVAGTAG